MSSPSPNKSFRSRMGGVMRRTSSVLISRPTTPAAEDGPVSRPSTDRPASIARSQEARKSTTSLTPSGATPPAPVPPPEPAPAPELPVVAVEPLAEPVPAVDGAPPPAPAPEPAAEPAIPTISPPEPASESTPAAQPASPPQPNGTSKAVKRLLPIAAQYQMYPSPIAESPMREAEETRRAEEDEKEGARTGALGPSPLAEAVETTLAPSPADADASPVDIPAPAPVEEVSAPAPVEEMPAPAPVESIPAYVPPPPMLDSSNPGAFTDEPEEMRVAEEPVPAVPAPAEESAPVPEPAAVPAQEEAVVVEAPVPMPEAQVPAAEEAPVPQEPVPEQAEAVPAREEAISIPDEVTRAPSYFDRLPTAEPAAEPHGDARVPEQQGWGVWDMPAAAAPEPENKNPFADPADGEGDGEVFLIPVVQVERTRDDAYDSAYAEAEEGGGGERGGGVLFAIGAGGGGEGISSIPMPVPGSIRSMPSAEDFARSSQGNFEHSTDERRPLLATRDIDPSYRATDAGVGGENGEGPSFRELGWIEYVLPDGAAAYYVHPTLRVTTDADLRAGDALARVGRALGYAGEGGVARAKMELWLREAKGKGSVVSNGNVNGKKHGKGHGKGKGKWRGDLGELGLARWWVDHVRREVSAADDVVGREDHLDMEYRYWAFMEAHPAHAALPFAARREAMEVLTWAWTDRLLPPQHTPLPPPFTASECHELLGFVRPYGDMQPGDAGIQSIVLTRIVSRIFMRVAHWRQHHFRSHKPLPTDHHRQHHLQQNNAYAPGFVRRAADVLAACLLLGVPYLFYTRAGPNRLDAEGGAAARNTMLPMLVVGACTCLLVSLPFFRVSTPCTRSPVFTKLRLHCKAALILSASITFLSLPGLDSIARTVALVVVLLTVGSMASSLVALFRYKGELALAGAAARAQPAAAAQLNPAAVGREGLVLVSTRSLIMSLPLVLLIYAVLGFVAAVVLYSFFGVNASAMRFQDYTRWAVLGALGGLAGVLTTSVLLLRR
ncbi:hypothetical protein C8R44DRAFT_252675 [Mycena epipterygia]|nr:hypothetical protein C8R44DRAFT_252675 [Mycena epipterygia]